MSSRNDKDRWMIVIVIVILSMTLWLVRCSNSKRTEAVSTDSCVVLVSDTIPDTIFHHKTKKEKAQKLNRNPVERNFLDEKLSD